MICPKCQSENPEQNRFCGMCGSRLQEATPADQARPLNPQGADRTGNGGVRRPFIVSTTGITDIAAHTLNTRVAVPTQSSTTHSGYVAPLRVDEIAHGNALVEPPPAPVDPHDEPMFATKAVQSGGNGSVHLDTPEQETEEPNVTAPEVRTVPPVTRRPVSQSVYGLDTAAPIEEVRSEPLVEPASERNAFLRMDEPGVSTGRDVSGPSFLGLGSPVADDYLLEDEAPVSHTRRNILLLALVVVAILGFLEWRASARGDSTNPVDVLHLKLPKRKGQGEVVVLPPASNSASSTTGADTGTSNASNGKPDLIAEPNQPAAQMGSGAKPTDQTAAQTKPADSPADTEATNEVDPATTSSQPPPAETGSGLTAKSNPPAGSSAAPPKPAPAQVAKSVPPSTPPATKPSAIPQSDATANAKSPAGKAASPAIPPATSEADASLSAGGFELQKGKAAGATEEGRMWLWKAVAKGNGEAPVLLADMYLEGKGVAKDCEQAVLLLNAAAKKSNPRARSRLGSMYASGECVPQDRVQAYKWMTSALQANPGSEWIEKNRQQLLTQMTPSERQRAASMH